MRKSKKRKNQKQDGVSKQKDDSEPHEDDDFSMSQTKQDEQLRNQVDRYLV
jgi:hypothetical protein